MSTHANPYDGITTAYQRVRCIQELLTHVQPGKNLDLGPDAVNGLYFLLEDVLTVLAEARTLSDTA